MGASHIRITVQPVPWQPSWNTAEYADSTQW